MFPKESYGVVRALPSQGGRPSSQVAKGNPTLPISGALWAAVLLCHSPGVCVAAV